MKRKEYGVNKDRNIEDMVFVIFSILLKQSKKRKKTHDY